MVQAEISLCARCGLSFSVFCTPSSSKVDKKETFVRFELGVME